MTEPRRGHIADRLRGTYHIGVDPKIGPLDGKMTFTREFPGQEPLCYEAAQVIEVIEAGIHPECDLEDLIARLLEPADPLNMGKTYVVPIRAEAADLLQTYLDQKTTDGS